jgi:hypothetical protein
MTGPTSVALVGEDVTHAVLLGALLRVSIRDVARELGREWIVDNLEHDPVLRGEEHLEHVFAGLRYTSSIHLDTNDIAAMTIGGRVVKTRGFVDGVAQGVEAHKWRLILLKLLGDEPDVVLVAKDTDGDPRGLIGLRQVVDYYASLGSRCATAIAAPHQDAESWLIAGFEPDGRRETEALREVSAVLGFDPRHRLARLTAHPNEAETDAKRVLRRLLLLDPKSAPLAPDELSERWERLLGDLKRLRARGADIGVVAFLDELRRRIVPLVIRGA